MNITFDTNVFGPLISPDDYPDHDSVTEFAAIANAIKQGAVQAAISEASLTLEALDRHTRIDHFFREWANKNSGINLPRPAEVRAAIFERAFHLGISVLHAPRIAIGPLVHVPDVNWASDARFSASERQSRTAHFMRAHSAAGPQALKDLGADLVALHELDVSNVIHFPGWPRREELVWLKGIIAEYDNPIRYASPERFTRHVRDLIGEWTDVDILASHYGYGNQFFCTLDRSRDTGTAGILHPSNTEHLRKNYGVEIRTPIEIVTLMQGGV